VKFTDGYWKVREGYRPHHPREIYETETDGRSVTLYGPTMRVRDRGDTLNQTMLTVRLRPVAEGVVAVRVSHFTGGVSRGPTFAIAEDDGVPATVRDTEDAVTLSSGGLSVVAKKGPGWDLSFAGDGVPLTRSTDKSVGYVVAEDGSSYVHEQFVLGVGTRVYGLGERFGPLVKNGQAIDIWNEDGGTSSEQAYKNVPFFLTNRGYGVFVNDPGPVSFEVASEKVSRVQFSVPGEELEYFVVYGPSPKTILERYTALTGRPALPPRWSFGLWLTTSFTTSYDEDTVSTFLDGMAEREIPVDVFHFDTFWMHDFSWCDFRWDTSVFPDPEGLVRRLKDRGIRVSLWINPYIAQRSALFSEAAEHGYLLRRPNGEVWQIDQWQPGMGIVDFTNPAAREWFRTQLRPLLRMGVDSFKTDFGERIPVDVVYHDGSDPVRMHNYFAHLYNQTVFELLREERGEGEAVVFARSATAGGQQFPVHWGGDCESTFESMAESLRGGLSLGLCGFGFWSHDIGGFEGTPAPSVYKRWVAFGLLSSHSRLHGSTSYRVPWLIDDESVDVLRRFVRLKALLMPYLFAAAIDATRSGVPVMRALMVEFPEDPAAETAEEQYMLGDALLVAPVFSEAGDVTFYLPEGRWLSYFSGEVVAGGRWVSERHDVMSLPLYVRDGAVVAHGHREDRVVYDYDDEVELRVYLPVGSEQRGTRRVEVHGDNGVVSASFEVEIGTESVVARRTAGSRGWRLSLVEGPDTPQTRSVGADAESARIGRTVR